MNTTDWIFQGKLNSNSQTAAFTDKMVGFRWNDDYQLSGIDIGVDLTSGVKVMFRKLLNRSAKMLQTAYCLIKIKYSCYSRLWVTLADICEGIEVVKLSFVGVVQYDFVDSTLLRV